MQTNHKIRTHKNDFTRVTSVLTPRLVERLDALATQKTTSRSLLIRQACESFLHKMESEREMTANA